MVQHQPLGTELVGNQLVPATDGDFRVARRRGVSLRHGPSAIHAAPGLLHSAHDRIAPQWRIASRTRQDQRNGSRDRRSRARCGAERRDSGGPPASNGGPPGRNGTPLLAAQGCFRSPASGRRRARPGRRRSEAESGQDETALAAACPALVKARSFAIVTNHRPPLWQGRMKPSVSTAAQELQQHGTCHPRGRRQDLPGQRPGRWRTSNLEIDNGEFVVMVGPSGCGKIDDPCAWSPDWRKSARARSRSATGWSTTCRRRTRDIAMVFQNYALYPAHDGV